MEWKKLGEKIVYQGYRTIIRKQYQLPDGRVTDFDIIKNRSFACVLAITPDQKVVLTEIYRTGPEKMLLELPGGAVDGTETAEQAAARELVEETGYSGTLHYVAESIQDGYTEGVRYHFVATHCTQTQAPAPDPDGTESGIVHLMSLEDFKKHLHTGQLSDVQTAYYGLEFLKLL